MSPWRHTCVSTFAAPHHSLAEHPQVDLPLDRPLQDVLGRHAAVDLQCVEEHVAVQSVSRPPQT